MVGFARLERIEIIVETMPGVSQPRWQGFVQSLLLGKRLEFNEGDITLSGGIQVIELTSFNPTTVIAIAMFLLKLLMLVGKAADLLLLCSNAVWYACRASTDGVVHHQGRCCRGLRINFVWP